LKIIETDHFLGQISPLLVAYSVGQWWGTCGPCEHLIWPAPEFPLPKLEHSITSK